MILFIFIAIFTGINGFPSSYMSGPQFVLEPAAWFHFTNSSGGLISCKGDGVPVPQIRWIDSTDNDLTNIIQIREVTSNGSLQFFPFSSSDFRQDVHFTNYRCILTNAVGSIVSRKSQVKAEIIHNLDVQVNDVYVTNGNVAVFKCTIPSIGKEHIEIDWIKDGTTIAKPSIFTSSRFIQTSDGELHVLDATLQDSNHEFVCRISCKHTGRRYSSRPAHIIITDERKLSAPKIEYSSVVVRARVGNEVDLSCVARGLPEPTYKWYHADDSGSLIQISSGVPFVRPLSSVLYFPRVQASDTSRYVCVASNYLGDDRRDMNLIVVTPLIAFIRPQKQVVDSGSQAMFNCSVQGGDGETQIAWLKDGKRLINNNRISILNHASTLLLDGITRSDRGMYQCYVSNQYETAQAASELILGAVAPELEETFIEETIQPGLMVSLKCVSNGNPPPRFTWMLDGAVIRPGDGYIIGSFLDSKGSVISHLNISVTHLEHGGEYTCAASNILGVARHSAMLNIYGPPTARAQLNLTAVSGKSITLRCPVSGFPISSTSWFHENEVLPSNHKQRVFTNGTLFISSLQEEKDVGKYYCNVYNQQGQRATATISLTILTAPELMPFHFSNNLKEGGKAYVACTAMSGDLPINFVWRKDGKLLNNDPDIHEQVLDMVSTLRIDNLAGRHSGLYTCIATNAASSSNYTAKLVVKASPNWSIEPTDTTVLYHQTAIITCQANGYPSPRITWKRARGSIENEATGFITLESDSRTFVYSNGSIVIRTAERQHEGYYSCEAENGIGSPIIKVVFLKVNIPAHFRVRHINESGLAGQKVTLSCEAEGDQPIKITWNNQPSSFVNQRKTPTGSISEFVINSLSPKNAGIYRCTANNAFGYDHMTVQLTVKERPSSPVDVKITEVGSRWLRINWTMASLEDHNTFYLLQYQNEMMSSWNNITLNRVTNTIVESLTPNTIYNVRLIAINEIGTSVPSNVFTVKTLQEAPSSHPIDLIAEKINVDSMLIKWQPPSMSSHNGPLLGYKVFHHRQNENSNGKSKTIRSSGGTLCTIRYLRPYTTYEIVVKAFNEIGNGPPTIPLTVTTLETTPSEPPENVQCSISGRFSMTVRWNRPKPEYWNGILEGYKILYKPLNPLPGRMVSAQYKRTTSLETVIQGLEGYTNYSVRVSAVTAAGDGVQSVPVFCATFQDEDELPQKVKALVSTSDSILIVWMGNKQRIQNAVHKYNVYIQEDSKEPKKVTVTGGLIGKYEFRHLKESQKYNLWVTSASTENAETVRTNIVSQIPTSKVPARIASFSRSVFVNEGSVLSLECNYVGIPTPILTWKGPHDHIFSQDFSIIKDRNMLRISGVNVKLSGNYSCVAENMFGKDEVIYSVFVLRNPSPVNQLSHITSSSNSVSISWKQTNDYSSSIIGYVVKCYLQDIEVKSVLVDSDTDNYTFTKLKCGTMYKFDIETISDIGRSAPSRILKAPTKGSVPDLADENELIFVNTTSATLYLDGWPDTDCEVLHFSVAYKLDGNWITVGSGYLSPQTIIIPDLRAATVYVVKVTAYNEAGYRSHQYTFTTKSLTGQNIPVDLLNSNDPMFVAQLNVIIPVMSAVICTFSLMICLFFIMRRKKAYRDYKSNSSKNECEDQSSQPVSQVTKKSSDEDADCDVYPYATFTVPSQFSTMNNKDKSHSMHRRRKLNTPPPSEALNYEISYISSQQTTLPIGGKRGAAPLSSFTTDNNQSMHKKRTPTHSREARYSSSSDSDTSPKMSRRSKNHHGLSNRETSPYAVGKLELFNFDSEKTGNIELNRELSSIVHAYRQRKIEIQDTIDV